MNEGKKRVYIFLSIYYEVASYMCSRVLLSKRAVDNEGFKDIGKEV